LTFTIRPVILWVGFCYNCCAIIILEGERRREMKAVKFLYFLVVSAVIVGLAYGSASAERFKIAIMQDEMGAAGKFRPMETYLKEKGIDFSFIGASNYPAAAKMFASGEVDAMFSGSAIAGMFIMKDLATPLVRPLHKEGYSTYHADIIARKGAPRYNGGEYFRGKRVAFTPLASSGEIFYHAVTDGKNVKATVLKTASHGAAIEALSNGGADAAIVKNHVWDAMKSKYPGLVKIGEDNEENPDGTLIVSIKADARTVSRVSAALLALGQDKSPVAKAVRDELGIKGYIKTTDADFKHTLELLKRAGVDSSFNFSFR
jgi:ABC-type phosphate/phosphonate transport system substrate-binding protein